MAFKVIEGGGPRPPDDFDMQLAAQSLRTLLIELLRAVARGNDPERRVTVQLIELYKLLGKPGMMVDTVVASLLQDVHSDLKGADNSDEVDREIERIVLASLQLVAEKLCWDDAAQGRTSQRERTLVLRIEARQQGMEARPRPRAPPAAGRRAFGDAVSQHQRTKGTVIHVEDPSLIEKYRAMGYRVYEDGEWEELIRKSPVTKLEHAALGAYVKAKGTLGDVKGAGPATNNRLVARGFIKVVQERGPGKVPYYGITPAGEAEWLRS